jgi:hypothetical protein
VPPLTDVSLFAAEYVFEVVLFQHASFANAASAQGMLYVYSASATFSSYSLSTTFTSTAATPGDSAFGWAVDAYTSSSTGITIVAVGAPSQARSSSANGIGAVYTYLCTTGGTCTTGGSILCPDVTISRSWGSSVAAGVVQYGPTMGQYFVAIGSPTSTSGGVSDAGLVYVYTSADGTTWSGPAIIASPVPSSGAAFGTDVAWDGFSDQVLAVGAPFASVNGLVFMMTNASDIGWSVSATLAANTGASTDGGYGTSVSTTSGMTVVGSPNAGYTYFYRNTATFPTARPTQMPTSGGGGGHSKSLSPGAAAGVAIGVLGALAIGGALVYYLFFAKAPAGSTLTTPVLSPMNQYEDRL